MQKLIAGLMFVVVALLAFISYQIRLAEALPPLTSPYQTIVLTNGQVYFGKLEQASGQHYILRDVFYVVAQADSEGKQIGNVLVRRGKELHEPEYMLLNRHQVSMIEPVGEKSRIAALIAEQSKAGS